MVSLEIDCTFVFFLTFIFAFHALILSFIHQIIRERYRLIAVTAASADPVGSLHHLELVTLLRTPGLETPERHFILKAYHPHGFLWLDDIHPPSTNPDT